MKAKRISSVTIKRALLIVCTVFFAVFQNAFLPAAGFHEPVFFLIPLCTAAAMFEHEFTGMLLGLLAGALWDISSPVSDGVVTLFFTVFACAAGLLTHYLLRNTVLSASVLTLAGAFLYSLLSFGFNCLTRDSGVLCFSVIFFYLRGVLYTTLLAPVFYYAVKAINKKLNSKNDRSVIKS